MANFSLVEIVGCLASGSGQAWTLANATEPAATKEDLLSTAELKNAEAKPLGTLTFLLINANAFKPELQPGLKLVAKGLLLPRTAGKPDQPDLAENSLVHLLELKTAGGRFARSVVALSGGGQ